MAVSSNARTMPWTRTPAAFSIRRAMALEQERIGQLVRERRTALGLDQAELAHRAGVDTKTVYRAESGQTENMRKSTREGLAKALEIEPDELLARLPAPDLIGSMNGDRDQLDRMEALLIEIRDALTADVGRGRDLRDLGREPADREQSQQAPGRTRTRRQGR